MSIKHPEHRHDTNPNIAALAQERSAQKTSSWDVNPVGQTESEHRTDNVDARRKSLMTKVGVALAAAGLLGGGVMVAKSVIGGGPDRAPGVSAPANPGESAKDHNLKPEVKTIPYAMGILEGATEEQWQNYFNDAIIPQLDWYFNTLLDNPDRMDEVPTSSFTDNPNSQFVLDIKEAARKIVSENPDVLDILGNVDPHATDKYAGGGYDDFSSVGPHPEQYPGSSSLALTYNVQRKDSSFSDNTTINIQLKDTYKMTQAEDGSLRFDD